ncbi:MAG: hypothetical protein LIP77_05170, partial [Planctomycetes bacterium]|nr:hypothetical protein [Planctomycetota bacterium]
VVRIRMPPLRDRPEDIPLLAEHFRQKYCARYNLERKFSPEVLAIFQSYAWPGNVRELENAVEGAVVRSVGTVIGPDTLPEETGVRRDSARMFLQPGRTLDEVEKEYILSELKRLGGNKSGVAKSLGIGLKTLYRKLEAYGTDEGGVDVN